MTTQTQFLYSILLQARLVATERNESLSKILAIAAVNSNWGKKILCFNDLYDGTNLSSKFYQMAVAQVQKSSWVQSVVGSISCTEDAE